MVEPMLAKSSELVPQGEEWRYEIKWDGVRCIAHVANGMAFMQSRSGKTNYGPRFKNVADELLLLPEGIYDGELVRFNHDGDTLGLRNGIVDALVLFDVIESEGHDQRPRTLRARRELLEAIVEARNDEHGVDGERRVVLSPLYEDGEALYQWARARGIEGIVAKRLTSGYREGSRRGEWVKVKVRHEQEFVVAGWVPGKGARSGRFGGLVLGYYTEEGDFVYAGRVGCRSDMDDEIARSITPQPMPPFDAGRPKEERDAFWCAPELVVQVAFQRWTEDGRLWHPTAKGLRHDKEADDVTRDP